MEKFYKFIIKFCLIMMLVIAVCAIALGVCTLLFPQVVLGLLKTLFAVISIGIGIALLISITRIL